MNCPHCQQPLRDGADPRCPACGGATGGVGGVRPPRAADRAAATSARLAADGVTRGLRGSLDGLLGGQLAELRRHLPGVPLWASLFCPGLGQVLLMRLAGAAVAVAALLVIAWPMVRAPTDPANGGRLVWLTLTLVAVHCHVFYGIQAERGRSPAAATVPWLALALIIAGVWGETELFRRVVLGNPRLIYLGGYDLFAPVFYRDDVLRAVAPEEHPPRPRDIVHIDSRLIERVLGVAGDHLEVRGDGFWRNGQRLSETATETPLVPWHAQDVPDEWLRRLHDARLDLTVGPGQIGYCVWGRTLAVASVSALGGVIVEILEPRERRGRFVDGVFAPATPPATPPARLPARLRQ